MGKHYTTEFKLQILRPILNREMSIREAARFYNIPSNALVGTWLKRVAYLKELRRLRLQDEAEQRKLSKG